MPAPTVTTPAHPLAARAVALTGPQCRAVPYQGAELRSAPDGTGGESLTFVGYASVFDAPYEMADWLGAYTEVVRAGAFTKSLNDGADVPFKVNHQGLTLARTKSGTMQLAEDDHGLHVEAGLDPTSPHVIALRSAMERGDVDEMSFAFWIVRSTWSPDYEQCDLLELNINKGDVSAVNYGANPATAGAALRELHHLARQARAGTLDDDTAQQLAQVLQLVASADHAVDVAQPMLAKVLGVANPDVDPQTDVADEQQTNGLPLGLARALAFRAGV